MDLSIGPERETKRLGSGSDLKLDLARFFTWMGRCKGRPARLPAGNGMVGLTDTSVGYYQRKVSRLHTLERPVDGLISKRHIRGGL